MDNQRQRVEIYPDGPISVAFDDLPRVQLETVRQDGETSIWQRLRSAMDKREFTLAEDWEIDLSQISYASNLNGTIVIKAKEPTTESPDVEIPVVFDGASVPLARTISWLTQGILSPLGVMLVASIVHDFAFRFGYLYVKDAEGELQRVTIERHHADRLFRDIISTVNRIPLVPWVAWWAVRLGWFFVPFNGKPRGGEPPYVPAALSLLAVCGYAMEFYNKVFVSTEATLWLRLKAELWPLAAFLILLPILIWLMVQISALLSGSPDKLRR